MFLTTPAIPSADAAAGLSARACETPAYAPFDLQVAATVAALESLVATGPGFISHAQAL